MTGCGFTSDRRFVGTRPRGASLLMQTPPLSVTLRSPAVESAFTDAG